jgi:hypothetical protein
MSVIIIPSKRIYDITHTKLPNNVITKVEQSHNIITKEYGNILTQEYNLRFFSLPDPNVDISDDRLYPYPQFNYGFYIDLNNGKFKATLDLPYNKITRLVFEKNANGEDILTSHKLKSTRRVSQDGITFKEFTTLKNVVVEAHLNVSKILRVKYEIEAQETDGIVYSDNISIVGDYLTPAQKTWSLGTDSRPISLSGNELITSENTNWNKYAMDILSQYSKGKETVKIRCSIGEYYDNSGNVVISTKTRTRMIFNHYDKIVPMVKGANGIDLPLSTTIDGQAKVFEVIGVRIFYDGAVWQELTLKEFDESANIQIQLPAPTIRIADDILYIQDGSGLGKSFQIYVDGNAQVITDSKTYPISNLPSITQGSHSIYVVSLGYENYTSSGASNVVTYVKKVPLSAPVISIIDSTLVINDTSGKAEQFAVYANGTLILYTKASANTINLKSHISKEGTYTITVSAYADGYSASAMSNEVSFTRIVPLASPTITLSGKTITITDNSGKAETFNVYVDNTFLLSTPANQNVVDLSNLIFAEGNYEVFATALAEGYDESAKSNTVTVSIMMDIEGGYLTFVGEDGEFTLTGSKNWDGQVYISTDAQNWSEWNGNSVSSVDSKIYLRGRYNTTMRGNSSSIQAILRFDKSTVACYGNIANLLDYSKVYAGKTNEIEMAEGCFKYFFFNQTKLTRCPEMPLTTLSKGCYQEMYRGCTQLATLPKLPATTLLDGCYASMFYGCTSIKLSTTKSDEYSNEYRIPTEGNISNAPATSRYNMFANTGGTFKPTGNADILNKVFYTANEIV